MSPSEAVVVHEDERELESWEEGGPGSVRWRTLISADRTPTDSLTVGVAEIEPGESRLFRPHRHAQPEVYYILSGEGVVTISGTDHTVRPGNAVFIPGGAAHGARNTGSELLRLLYVFPSSSFAEIQYEFSAP
jgi:mannose-6-phosphate isomerase-like protein (cupin superfamily)